MTIEEVKNKYKDEWVLAEVLQEDEMHNPTEVEVIVHSKNREEVYDALSKVKPGSHITTLYTGKFPAKGYAVAFWFMENDIKFNPHQPVIVLGVVLKGIVTETARMALDTGASFTMVPWKIARALGLKPEFSEETTQIVTASGVEMTPIVTLSSISVGKNSLENIKAVVHDLPSASYVDGLLGLNFLKHFKVILNFPEGVLKFDKK